MLADVDPREPKVVESDDGVEWEGLARRRFERRYALLFALLFGPTSLLIFDRLNIGRGVRGGDVGALNVGIFVVVVLVIGSFLGKRLAWRLDARRRSIAVFVTIVIGLPGLIAAWMSMLDRLGG